MTDQHRSLTVDFSSVPARIRLHREFRVPDDFWLEIRASWGSDGPSPSKEIWVDPSAFLRRLSWLRSICVRYSVGIFWETPARSLVTQHIEQLGHLDRVLDGIPDTPEAELRTRLAHGRFRRELRPFQWRDLGKLTAVQHGANFSVPGAGKTAVTYALYEAERLQNRVSRLLVVAPISAFDSWVTELSCCFAQDSRPELAVGEMNHTAEVLIINYQRLQRMIADLSEWVSSLPTHVVLDEAHRAKRGMTGLWGRLCSDLTMLAARRDILTGTPAPQSSADLGVLFDFVWPGQSQRIFSPNSLSSDPTVPVSPGVSDRIAPLFVRTTKSDLKLPDLRLSVQPITAGSIQEEIYAALLDRYRGSFSLSSPDRVSLAQMGLVMMYLLEAASNPALLTAGSSRYDPINFRHPPFDVPDGSPLRDLLERYAQYETPAKFSYVAVTVADNTRNRRKTLVWSNFVRNLETLRRELAAFEPAMIHGGVISDQGDESGVPTRESEIERFRHDDQCSVLLANPAALGEGVSLHMECHDAIYIDRSFNAGQFLQSIDRIHRLGLPEDQETSVTVLTTIGTIDEIVAGRLATKVERMGELLDDREIGQLAFPEEEEVGPAIESRLDVHALFQHLRGDDDPQG